MYLKICCCGFIVQVYTNLLIVFIGGLLYLLKCLERNISKKEISCCEGNNEEYVLSGKKSVSSTLRNFTKFNNKWFLGYTEKKLI